MLVVDGTMSRQSTSYDGSPGTSSLTYSVDSALYIFNIGENKIGPLFHYDKLGETASDMLYGASFAFGKKYFLEVGGGLYQTSFEGKGWGIVAKIGASFEFSERIRARITLPVVYTKASFEGGPSMTKMDIAPYVGFSVAI